MRAIVGVLLCVMCAPALAQTCPVAPADPVPRDAARLIWTAPTTNTDGTAIAGTLTYTVYERVGTTDTLRCTTTATSAGQIGLTAGTHTWVLTARVGTGPESVKTAPASKTIAAPTPNPPSSILITRNDYWYCNKADGTRSQHVAEPEAFEACVNEALVAGSSSITAAGYRIVAR